MIILLLITYIIYLCILFYFTQTQKIAMVLCLRLNQLTLAGTISCLIYVNKT